MTDEQKREYAEAIKYALGMASPKFGPPMEGEEGWCAMTVEDADDEWILYTATDQLFQVVGALRDKGFQSTSQKLIYQPATPVVLTDLEQARAVHALIGEKISG